MMIRLFQGHAVKTISELYETVRGCELPDGLIIHERHESQWQSGNWQADVCNKYNRTLFDKWTSTYCPSMKMELVERHTFPPEALIRYPRYVAEVKQTEENLCRMFT